MGGFHLIAVNLKNNPTPAKATVVFVFITNYFRFSKDSITNQLQFAAQK
jgi:hypothetical protein